MSIASPIKSLPATPTPRDNGKGEKKKKKKKKVNKKVNKSNSTVQTPAKSPPRATDSDSVAAAAALPASQIRPTSEPRRNVLILSDEYGRNMARHYHDSCQTSELVTSRQEGGEERWSRIALVYNPIQIGSIDGTDTTPHDHGVVRALLSHYKPDPGVRGQPNCTLFVAHLNPRTTHEQISELFSRAGEVVRCRVVRDAVTGHSKRYAFIEMKSPSAAEHAYRTLDGEVLDNARILVDYELERTLPGWRPRRLGGGFGGTKESGQLRFGCRRRPFQRPLRPDVHAPSTHTGSSKVRRE